MEPILDETSLVPCPSTQPSSRVLGLARALQAFDELGAARVLRSVRDAADRDICDGSGLRRWCFDRSTNPDAGRLLATRLASQPFVDGDGGLFAAAEGEAAVDASVRGARAFGAGLAALTDGVVVALMSAANPAGGTVTVDLAYVDADGDRAERIDVDRFVTAGEVQRRSTTLIERVDRAVPDGRALLARRDEMLSRLRFVPRAFDQILALTGNEPVFPQLLRHLRALDAAAKDWPAGVGFEPRAVTYSVESQRTLDDGVLGPMRNFPVPDGFTARQWSLHTKLTGGAAVRLYFCAERTKTGDVVLVGYFGGHLPTVDHRT